MLTEYKIKIEEGGITITQRVENGAEPPDAIADGPGKGRLLARHFAAGEGEGEGESPPPPPNNGGNGGGGGTTIIVFSTFPGPHGKGGGG